MSALTKDSLVQLAEMRLAEAEHLLSAGHFSVEFFLGGYALELGLKTRRRGLNIRRKLRIEVATL